ILHRDRVMVGNDTTRPHPSGMRVLPSRLLVQAGGFTPRLLVAAAGSLSLRASAAGHLPLGAREFGSAATAVARVGQVMGGAGGRRRGGDTPVDTDSPDGGGRGFDLAAY